MGTQRTSFAKLQRDQAKKAKADAKRARRQQRPEDGAEEVAVSMELPAEGGQVSAAALLELVEAIHKSYEAGTVSYEDFEETKAELLGRLPID